MKTIDDMIKLGSCWELVCPQCPFCDINKYNEATASAGMDDIYCKAIQWANSRGWGHMSGVHGSGLYIEHLKKKIKLIDKILK